MAVIRPSIRRTARVLLPVLIIVAAWNVWNNVEQRRLQQRLAAFGDDERVPLGQEGAAARFYAAAAIASVNLEASAIPGASPLDVIRRQRERMVSAATLPSTDASSWSEIAAEAATPARLIDEGAGLPFAAFAAGTDFNLRASGLINAARFADVSTLVALERGDAATAFGSLLARVQVLRAFANHWLLQQSRVRLVQDLATDLANAMSRMRPSVEDLRALDEALSALPREDEVERTLNGMARMQAAFGTAAGRGPALIIAPLLAHQANRALEVALQAQQAARQPWPRRLDELARVKGPSSSFDLGVWSSNMARCIAFFDAVARVARAAIAVEQFRRSAGTLPATLAELPLGDGATDPFSGEPLRYKVDGGAFTIYSVGANRQDDGGRLQAEPPVTAAPGSGLPVDIGVRVSYDRQR